MRSLLQDLVYGLRMSRKSLGFTIVAVLTLAVGIAANTAVFSWIDNVLLRPLPGVTDGSRLAAFESLRADGDSMTTSYPDYRDYRDHLKLVSGIAVATPTALSIGEEEHAERIWGELVSGNYFAVLGVRTVLGRSFSPSESGDTQGAYPVAVISQSLWKRRFHSDPAIVGSTIRVNRRQLTVVGVAAPEFRGILPGLTFQIWIPAPMAAALNTEPDWMQEDRQTRNLIAVVRLKPGVSIAQARTEAAALAHRLAESEPDTNKGVSVTILPVREGHFGAQSTLTAPLKILMAVCGVVLLIVCANVANLLLARTMARQNEFAMRIALGAGRGRLARQLLTESLVLAMMGGVAGMPLAVWMSQSLAYLVPTTALPITMDVHMDGAVLAFTVLLCVAACLVSGIVPAIQSARTDLNDVLKQGGRGSGSSGPRSRRIRGALVVSEVALALVAIIGTGLFAKSFQLARQIQPGFDAHNVLISHLYLSTAGYSVPDRKLFCQRLRERLESQPGIAAVSYADMVPLGFAGGPWEPLQVEGYTPAATENMQTYRNVVAPGFFDLLKIPLVEGRDFAERDNSDTQPVMIVNQSFVRRYYHGAYPLGRRVHGWGKWFTIVGVVKDSKYHTPTEPPQPYFYVPFRQVYRSDLEIVVYIRALGDPGHALAALQREVRGMDANVGVFDAMPLTDYMGASLFPQKVAATLLAVLGAIALVLAAVGLYSVMAYSITQRTQEIGVRLALGARSGDVLRLVIRQGMGLTLAGLLAGVLGAIAVTRLAAGLLIHVSPVDPTVFGAAAVFLTTVSLAACYLPARRATRIDPNAALRCQ